MSTLRTGMLAASLAIVSLASPAFARTTTPERFTFISAVVEQSHEGAEQRASAARALAQSSFEAQVLCTSAYPVAQSAHAPEAIDACVREALARAVLNADDAAQRALYIDRFGIDPGRVLLARAEH